MSDPCRCCNEIKATNIIEAKFGYEEWVSGYAKRITMMRFDVDVCDSCYVWITGTSRFLWKLFGVSLALFLLLTAIVGPRLKQTASETEPWTPIAMVAWVFCMFMTPALGAAASAVRSRRLRFVRCDREGRITYVEPGPRNSRVLAGSARAAT
jgi:hypothetical protein